MGERSVFAITLAIAGALLLGIGVEVWLWFKARDSGRDVAFPLGDRLFRYGVPPERYRGAAMRLIGSGAFVLVMAFPAVLRARV